MKYLIEREKELKLKMNDWKARIAELNNDKTISRWDYKMNIAKRAYDENSYRWAEIFKAIKTIKEMENK